MKHSSLIKSVIGQEVYEVLSKAITKLGTKSVVDITELHDALKIAPKSIIVFLMKELKEMKKDEAKEVKLPWDDKANLLINKKDEDVYAGSIDKDGKTVHEFSLCSIPQLAAHLLSFSEMYDEVPEQEESHKEKAESSQLEHESLREDIKSLENKINALMMLSINSSAKPKEAPSEEIEKSEDMNKNLKKFDGFVKSLKKLQKGGLAPTMPKPPKPGVKVGGSQGITQAGLHGDKTAASDSRTKPITQLKNPNLKVPKATATQPVTPKTTFKSEKTITLNKSELSGTCSDCGQQITEASCACFKVLSAPEVIRKSNSEKVTLKFGKDWDQDAVLALHKSMTKGK